MEKPIRRTSEELRQPNFVDFLLNTYSPKKNSAGEHFSMALDYLTNERSYMTSADEKAFIKECGFAPIGFLEVLRSQMTKTGGFGICINNNDFEKAMYGMVIDYKADLQEMQKYYDQLLEHGLLIIISDSQGTQYVTSPQQVFNFEYKMWSRWNDNKNSKNSKNKKKAAEMPVSVPVVQPSEELFPLDEENPDTWL